MYFSSNSIIKTFNCNIRLPNPQSPHESKHRRSGQNKDRTQWHEDNQEQRKQKRDAWLNYKKVEKRLIWRRIRELDQKCDYLAATQARDTLACESLPLNMHFCRKTARELIQSGLPPTLRSWEDGDEWRWDEVGMVRDTREGRGRWIGEQAVDVRDSFSYHPHGSCGTESACLPRLLRKSELPVGQESKERHPTGVPWG